MFPFLHPEQLLLIIYQVDLPTLGRDCHHIVNLLINIHVHRSKGQLSPWEYPRLEVRFFFLRSFPWAASRQPQTQLTRCDLPRSYLVLTAGFFFAPYRPGGGDGEESVVFGPMVTVRTITESLGLFWATP